MACNNGQPCLLYFTFSLLITHQPPPLCFSLSVSSLHFPFSAHPHLHGSLPFSAGEQGLIWRAHNNSCNSPALVGPPQARPGQGFSVRLTCVWLEELNSSSSSSTLRCHHTITSLPPTSLFISRQPASRNPTPISDSCAHIPARLHAQAVKWDTGEERREERSPVWRWPSL